MPLSGQYAMISITCEVTLKNTQTANPHEPMYNFQRIIKEQLKLNLNNMGTQRLGFIKLLETIDDDSVDVLELLEYMNADGTRRLKMEERDEAVRYIDSTIGKLRKALVLTQKLV